MSTPRFLCFLPKRIPSYHGVRVRQSRVCKRFTTLTRCQGTTPTHVNRRFLSQSSGVVQENQSSSTINLLLSLAMGVSVAGGINFLLDFPAPAQLLFSVAKDCPEVQELLGTPIERSYFWEGSVGEHEASVQIPISGPNGKGTVSARMVKDAGSNEWQALMLLFRQGDVMINLDPPPPPEVPVYGHGSVYNPETKKIEKIDNSASKPETI